MNEQTAARDQRSLDRSGDFDQVSEHNHATGIKCWCGKWPPPPISIPDTAGLTSEDYARECPSCGTTDFNNHGRLCLFNYSDPIAASNSACSTCGFFNGLHRSDCVHYPLFSEVEMKSHHALLAAMTAERNDLMERLALADDRIRQFELLTQNLAAKIDEIEADFIFLTGKSCGEWLGEYREAKQGAAA